MDQTRGEPGVRHGVLALVAAAIALLLPTLTSGLDGPSTLTAALLAVAVAALVGAAHGTAGPRARTTSAQVATRRPVPIVLATRATDPTHHPLRPRAPGTV